MSSHQKQSSTSNQSPPNRPSWAKRLSQRFSNVAGPGADSPSPPPPPLPDTTTTPSGATQEARRPLPSGNKAVWLDCDPGHDDAIALLVALFAPSHDPSTNGKFDSKAPQSAISLLGVSAVGGNAPVQNTFANAARLLEYFGAPLPRSAEDVESNGVHLFMGAADPLVKPARCDPGIHGEDGLGGVTGLPSLRSVPVQKRVWASYDRAVEGSHQSQAILPRPSPSALLNHWYRLLHHRIKEKLPKMTVVATGPLTNVALLIKSYPELVAEGVEEIVIMGGVEGQRGNRGPLAEFNILVDPEAASIVFNHEIKVVMAGLNVTHQLIFTPNLLQKLLTLKSSAPRSRSQSIAAAQPSPPDTIPRGVDHAFNDPTSASMTTSAQSNLEATQDFRKTISSILTFFAQTYATEFGFTDGPPVHDVLAVAYVVDPTLFWTSESDASDESRMRSTTVRPPRYNVQVECGENSLALGATVVDIYAKREHDQHPDSFWGRGGRNVEVLNTVDVDRVWQLFFACVERAERHKLGFSAGVITPVPKSHPLP